MKRQISFVGSIFLLMLIFRCSDKPNPIFIPNASTDTTTTTNTLAAPTLISPENASTDMMLMPTLTWSTVTGASTYRVQVSTTSTFATMIADVATFTEGGAEFTSPLDNNTTYYWRVNANNTQESSSWSETWSFTTLQAVPDTPILSSPSNGATGISVQPTLTWGTVSGATAYRIQVSTVSTFATTISDDSTLTIGSQTLTSSLATGTIYYWRVNAKNSGGTSSWSTTWSFITAIAAPATPILTSPSDGANSVALLPTFAWGTVSGATAYRIQVSSDSTFITTAYDDSSVTAGSKTLITSLIGGTVYYWRVNAKNTSGTSIWSLKRSFTTLVILPAVPILSSPASGATGISVQPTLTWGTVSGASTYRIQISTSSTFITTVSDDSILTIGSQTLTSSLATGTTYYWRVNAKNGGGTSSWSTVWNITTATAAPTVPILTSPSDGASSVALLPTFTWGTVSGASGYRIQVSSDSTFGTTICNDSTVIVGSKTLTTSLASGVVYYWRVNAKNSSGISIWSSTRSFTTLIPIPTVPVLSSPANITTGISILPTFTWGTVSGATTYRIQVSTISTFATITSDDSTLTTGSKTQTTGLANGTKYFWRVNAKNSGGTGPWSSVWSFTTAISAPSTPMLSSPTDGAGGVALLPTFTWGTVSGATTYMIQVSTESAFGATFINDSAFSVGSKTLTRTLSNGVLYYWRVNAKNAGGTSTWSTTRSFITIVTLPAVPILSSPINGTTGISIQPTLTWGTASGASTYHIQVSTVSTFVTTVCDDSTLTIGSKTLASALSSGTTYYWRVNAKNSGGTGPWSSAWSFTTEVLAPVAPILTSPTNGASGVALLPTFTWGTVSGATRYRIQVSTVNTFTTTVSDDSSLTTGSKILTLTNSLANGTTYYWRVNAKNSAGTGSWSSVWSFTTQLSSDNTTTVTDIDGNIYHTVKIGTQTWTVENLRTTRYFDGTAIPLVSGGTAWKISSSPCFCWYNNGALYNWYVINTGGLAPAGWHVPTDAEWDTLANYLIVHGYNYDGTTDTNKIAKAMAANTNWMTSTIAGAPGNNLSTNNSSGFSALPGGSCGADGNFYNAGTYGSWWSSTVKIVSAFAYNRTLGYTDSGLTKGSPIECCGFSVRLIKN